MKTIVVMSKTGRRKAVTDRMAKALIYIGVATYETTAMQAGEPELVSPRVFKRPPQPNPTPAEIRQPDPPAAPAAAAPEAAPPAAEDASAPADDASGAPEVAPGAPEVAADPASDAPPAAPAEREPTLQIAPEGTGAKPELTTSEQRVSAAQSGGKTYRKRELKGG